MAERACPDRRDLERLVLGLIRGPEADTLEAHFAECGTCLATVRGLPGSDELMSDLQQGEQDPTLPVDPGLLNRLFHLPADSSLPDESGTPGDGDLDPPQEPGELGRLGPYSVRQVLGEGGMGIVDLARHRHLKRLVALKMLRTGAGKSRERLGRFRREAEVLARLQHPNIVQVLDVGEHAGRPYLAMEHVEGGSLAQRLRSGPLPPGEAAEMLEVLARAVHAAHEAGVIHRDLKPANVLLASGGRQPPERLLQKREGEAPAEPHSLEKRGSAGASPSRSPTSGTDSEAGVPPETRPPQGADAPRSPELKPKITDFGLARQLGEAVEGSLTGYETRSGAILGTPGYMAPEQAGGQPDAGPAVDVYALGAILYECLTGRPPFQAASLLETLEMVRTQEPVPPRRLQPGVPRDLETVCLKCLHKDPQRRYPSALELADDLRRFLDGGSVRARPTPGWEKLGKWARRRPALAALLVVSVLSLVVLIAGAVVYERRLKGALDRAEASRERADANYRSARNAMSRILLRASDQRRADLPRLKELRREQQEDAVAFFLGLANQQGDSPEIRADAAWACLEAGRLQTELGRHQAARESMNRGLRLFSELAAEFPNERRYRVGLATAYSGLWTCGPTAPDAEQNLKESLALREALVREDPDSIEYRADLAQGLHNLGHLHYDAERRDEAERCWLRAVSLKEEILREQPDSREQRLALTLTQINLSLMLQLRPERQPDAQRFHDEAETHLVHLLEQHARDYEVMARLATLRLNWAHVLQARGEVARAEEDLGKNIAMLTEARRLEPEDHRTRDALFRSHGVRALVRQAQNRWAEAVADQRRVVELVDEAGARHHRLFLAMSLARAGDHTAAMAEVEALAVMKEHAALANLLHLARACCWSARAAAEDSHLATAERSARADRHAARAVELLGRARAVTARDGWPTIIRELKQGDDYRPLWGRVDFQRLLDE